MVLIGLIGQKGSGKDTLSDYIKTNFDNYVSYSFADPLKDVCHILFGIDRTVLYGNQEDKEKIVDGLQVSTRKVLQSIGTDLFRNKLIDVLPELKDVFGKDSIWIYSFRQWYEKNKDKNVIVSDVRFLNEAECIRELGGILIFIDRKDKNENDKHESEQELKKIKYDFLIQNNRTLEIFFNRYRMLNDYIIERMV